MKTMKKLLFTATMAVALVAPAVTEQLGDVNFNKRVDPVDASQILEEYVSRSTSQGTTFTDPQQALNADVDGNGVVDAFDASAVLGYYKYTSTPIDADVLGMAAWFATLGPAATGDGNPDAAVNKPVLTVTVDGAAGGKVFAPADARGKQVACTIEVSGANKVYAATGFHVRYDARLALATNGSGEIDVEKGRALSVCITSDPVEDPTAPAGWKGFFVATTSDGNTGKDGTMWEFSFTVPEDAAAGDVYPIDIVASTTGNPHDLFVGLPVTAAGLDMQAYAFSKGIFHAGNTNAFAAGADVAACAALAGIAGDADGYIAIADPAPVTYPLWVGGVQVCETNQTDILGDGTASFVGTATNGTLSLSNAFITNAVAYQSGYASTANICAGEGLDLTISLSGSNRVENAGEDGYGVVALGNIAFTDGGILVTEADQNAIGVRGVILIDGVTVSATGGRNGVSANRIMVTNATVNATSAGSSLGASAGLVASGGIVVADSSVVASGPFFGVLADAGSHFTVSGESRVEATATDSNKEAIYASGGITVGSGLDLVEPDGGGLEANGQKYFVDVGGNSAQHVLLEPCTYSVTVVGGSTTNTTARAGEVVTVVADAPAEGEGFVDWSADDAMDLSFATAGAATTTFRMPGRAVTVTAVFKEIVVAPIADQTYTGEPIEPEVSVSFDGVDIALFRDTDYEVSYTGNTDSGTATVTVTMLPPRLGSKTVEFTILPKPSVSNVTATVHEPWDGTVSISFNVTNSPAAACPDWNQPYLSITATDNETGSNYVSSATALSAKAPYQIGDALAGSNGTHEVTWDFKAQGIDFASTNVTFTVAYVNMPEYCVIDLSGGTNAESYAVTYLDAVADPAAVFNTDAYKTDNLVMRLIAPGTFEMGYSGSTETTEITNAFYCAVFETTQRQWELVTGDRPSNFTNETCYATRPVEKVSWNMIRGDANTYNWPNVQGVDPESFLGVLRQKTDLNALDLPTEAQWEYACRAGTETDFNCGTNMTNSSQDPSMDVVGRYWYNGGQGSNDDSSTDNGTAAVGSYLPNAWGLYDMHGNVWEWCLDRYSSSGSSRVKRGGSWSSSASRCTSSYWDIYGYPSREKDSYGFRLVRTLSNNLESERSAEAAAGAERAGTVCAGTASKPICIGGKDFAAGDIALADYSGVYDGEGHTIGIATNAIKGLALRYSSSSSPMSPSSPSDTLPLFTNVCDMVVYVEATAPGYVAFTTNATVKITKASLKITARDQTYRYNGLQQGESDPIYATPEEIAEKVIVNGLKGGDTIDHVELGGEATEAGWYPIEPRGAVVVNPNNGDVTGNYDINYVNGTLTILGEAAVSNVVAASNEPWDGKVQIAFNVTNSPAACLPDWNMPFLSIVATDNVTGSNYVSVASALTGDTDTADGAHMVTWDFDAQGIEFYSTNVTFTVAYLKMPDWCVIDLSGGTNAVSYPVTYLAAEPDGGFTNDLYRTTKLAMRLIGPGTFEMGDITETEITNAFYCAVFETTQRQWELVTGERPSWFKNETCYATRPVERVSWNMIRGDADTYNWPNVQGVDPESFLGVLRQKTGLTALDLPAEAQWEYACRAGTTTDYNNGKNWSGNNPCPNMDVLGRYWYNGGSPDPDHYEAPAQGCETDLGTAAVGSYDPNKWGLYDMHGNVWEWCLERYSSSGSYRVSRGGSWYRDADCCTSSLLIGYDPSYEYDDYGFRLVRTLSNDFESERSAEAAAGAERAGTVCSAASEPITVGKKSAAELAAELKWKHLKATGTYFAQLKLTCTNWLDSGISDLKFMFADRVGADGKTSAALWSTPLRSANTNVEESAGTTYRFVALDESLIEEENTPVVYGVADLSAAAIPVAERTIEMYVRTGVAPEGQNAASAQVDDFVGYVCWTSSDEACAVPVVASGVKAGPKFGAVRPLAGAPLPSPKTLNESLALGVPVVEGASPYCRVAEFSVDGERIKGRIEVGAGENVGSLGANATVTVLGAASPAGPFEALGAVEVAEDGSFSLAVAEGAQFFKLRIDVKEVVR